MRRGDDPRTQEAALPTRAAGLLLGGTLTTLLLVAAGALVFADQARWYMALVLSALAMALVSIWAWLLRGVLGRQARLAAWAEARRAHSARLQDVHRIAGIGEWNWNLADDSIAWSDELYRMHGLVPRGEPFPVARFLESLHPDDRARVQQEMAQLQSGGTTVSSEYRIVRGDGEVRTVFTRGERYRMAGGAHALRGTVQDITELAETRARLDSTLEDYEFLFRNNPLPMWVFDRATLGFLAVNTSMVEHYGYSQEELLSATMLDIRPPEDAAAVFAAARTDAAQRPQGQAWTHLRKDGSRLRAAIFTRDIDFEGRSARMVLAEDVTERERNAERFQMIARATSDAVWDWDFEADTTWRSDNVYALFGYGPGEFGANLRAWEELLHPDDHPRVMASVNAAIASGDNEWECEYRLRRKDGSYADVRDRGFILRDDHGRALRAVGGMLDITQHKRDESSLRLLRQAIEATDNAIAICDARQADFPIVYVNPAFEEITGYARDEVLGRNCRFLQGPQTRPADVAAIRSALRDGRETQLLLRNHRKDGTPFWNQFHLAPVHDGDGVLTHYVGVLADVSERQRYEEQLAWRATHDELTGLPNRQLVHDRLQQAIAEAERRQREVAVVFVDLDDFKLINDSLGHGAGDTALKVVAQRLRAIVRGSDIVGRFGGDEFVIVMTAQSGDDGMHHVIARVSQALSQPIELAGVHHVLTPSLGHCRYPHAGHDAETLLKRADLAMYHAKRQGRNRAIAYREEFDSAVSQRLQLVSRLREALRNQEFELAFQPLFDPGGKLLALEALARWRHPERGLLLPSEFIAVCEESGLIVDLGRFVLREAARHHALLAATGLGDVRISVNVSAAQFGHELHRDVAEVVAEFALPSGALELEITESVIMDNPERAIEMMQRIAALGVCISVDDFGTGYSSLAYLKRLPIDRLKIDRSFVQDIGHDAEDAAICASIIGLGHLLDLRIVAEGVETEEQLHWLRERGCDELQGFLLGRPQPFEVLLPKLLGQSMVASTD
ncbi:MAG TPA: EAL domain-containing protein [Luteimonas sp.]|nr:EAL domain-containing protein [Luteimonas sp.]